MRRTARATRRRRQESTGGVSLFPFLAVLICTMGSLIVLLVVIARQAQVQAAQAADSEHTQIRERLDEDMEMAELVKSQLADSRSQTEAQLVDARLELGHVEDHIRELQGRLGRLDAAMEEAKSLQSGGARRREELAAELAAVQSAITQKESLLAEAEAAATERRNSFAIVPYQGPHETYRRPIYIECRGDAIILQPEGVWLTAEDFQGPLGPGNPLEVALRATREYLLDGQQFNPDDTGEPYPLLLVRPDGIIAYYAARAAMQSWASQFGYELIGDDWKLALPEPDPGLAQSVRHAVAEARVRQQLLAAAAPSRYGGRGGGKGGPPRYRVAPRRGGAVLAWGSPAEGHRDGPRVRAGADPRHPPGLAAVGQSGYQQGGGAASGFQAHAPGEPVGRRYDPGSAGKGSAEGSLMSGSTAAGQKHSSGSDHKPGASPARPGEWSPSEPDQDREPAPMNGQASQACSLAEKRGADWALPNAAQGSVPITRPIPVFCHPDRLALLPENDFADGKVVALGDRTEESVDALVSAVWERIDIWGIAGRAMYWQPVLTVRVAPGAEGRFADLQRLLEDSGLEVVRKADY